jgi:hypothetical protein
MEKLDFIFRKSRGIGDLIQDYIHLFKKIFKHFNRNIFQFLLPFLALFILIVFFASSLGVTFFNDAAMRDTSVIAIISVLALITGLVFFMFIPTFGIEYMFLLEERDAPDFTGKEIWQRLKSHLGKYFIFFWASVVVMIMIIIPLGLLIFVLALIPVVGAFAIGILGACLTTWIYCALFLYITGREPVFESFLAAFRLVKRKMFIYGLAAYIFQFLTQIILGILTFIPIIVLAIIAYNVIGFNEQVFISFGGKILLSLASAIFMIFVTIASIYLISFYVLIFFSSLEETYSEGTIDIIEQIGDTKDEF